MKEKLVAEGLGKSLPKDLIRSFDIGDEGDRADHESANDVNILLSARDKEKLLAVEEAMKKLHRPDQISWPEGRGKNYQDRGQ